MGLLEDLLGALDRWSEWRRIRAAPDRVDVLTERVAALEALLDGKAPAEMCRTCGERAMRLTTTSHGGTRENWRCGKCGAFVTKAV